VTATDRLQHGRARYAARRWSDAHDALSAADGAVPLGAEDLERLATAAYMLARDDEYVGFLERAHHAYVATGESLRAVRCAFWIVVNFLRRGEAGRAGGWLGRARRLIATDRECAERGYLLLARMLELDAAGEREAALAAGTDAVAIGERFGDADLLALAAQDVGIHLIRQGRIREGLGLLDEAMVALTSGELSPIVNGFVYCGVIMGCQAAHEPRRAQEWTAALTRWCDAQPDMVSFTGTCLVHRAEIMQLHGAWTDALREAGLAAERCARSLNEPAAAEARYRQAEVHRLRGEFGAAEAAYRDARRGGRDPQPGLALLRLAQGDVGGAAAAIRRLVSESTEPAARAGLLPAYVEIMLAADDAAAARAACAELAGIAAGWESLTIAAMAAHAQGATDLAGGDARAALIALRRAWRAWQELDAPYETARAGMLVGVACAALGDDETAAAELEAAREVFERLRAAPDVARLDALAEREAPAVPHGLTARELEVLRLVAAGRSNREIAATLVISEHTVARHVQNILAKLGVPSRTAASAFAFAHDLVAPGQK
jgi:DNA-binding CsgD family transcriptional regulator